MTQHRLPGAPALSSDAIADAAAPQRVGVRTVLGVFKLRIGTLIMITALAGLATVHGSTLTALQVAVLALAVLLSSAAAGAFNQFVEAESDRRMKRTRGRAFASGTLPTSAGWMAAIVGLLVLAVAAAALWVNVPAAVFTLAGAITYGGVYTLGLKRRTPWNIVIGGLAGSFAVLAGAAAADPSIGARGWALAWVLFLWTPPHFWSLAIASEADYRAACIPMLPVVVGPDRASRIVHGSAVLLVASTLLLPLFGSGWIVTAAAVAGGAHFLRRTHALARDPNRTTALASFFASMVHLGVLLAAVVLDAALR